MRPHALVVDRRLGSCFVACHYQARKVIEIEMFTIEKAVVGVSWKNCIGKDGKEYALISASFKGQDEQKKSVFLNVRVYPSREIRDVFYGQLKAIEQIAGKVESYYTVLDVNGFMTTSFSKRDGQKVVVPALMIKKFRLHMDAEKSAKKATKPLVENMPF